MKLVICMKEEQQKMIYKIQDFVTEWTKESEATQKLMDLLTDTSLEQAITPNHRKLGQIAWHLVSVISSMSGEELVFDKMKGEELAPASAATIAQEYKRLSQAVRYAVQTQWTDEYLLHGVPAFGEGWTNGASLRLLIQHEIHHRGQMSVLMRQAGLNIAGIYGPTREEWIEQGVRPYI
jgi:uncharacterized damage-inducible protein DinB